MGCTAAERMETSKPLKTTLTSRVHACLLYLHTEWNRKRRKFHSHVSSQADTFGTVRALMLSIHGRHKVCAQIPRGHYLHSGLCVEPLCQWAVGLRACSTADRPRCSVYVCLGRTGERERGMAAARREWRRMNHKTVFSVIMQCEPEEVLNGFAEICCRGWSWVNIKRCKMLKAKCSKRRAKS